MSAISQDALSSPDAPLGRGLRERARSFRQRFFSVRERCGVRSFHARLALSTLVFLPPGLGTFYAYGSLQHAGNAAASALLAAFVLCLSAYLLSSVCIGVQRLHDLGHRGWFYLVCLAPVVGMWVILYCAYVPGHAVPNRFGTVPAPSRGARLVGPLSMALFAIVVAGSYASALFWTPAS